MVSPALSEPTLPGEFLARKNEVLEGIIPLCGTDHDILASFEKFEQPLSADEPVDILNRPGFVESSPFLVETLRGS